MDHRSSTTPEQPAAHKGAARSTPRVNLAGLSIVILVAFMGGIAALAEPSSQAFTQGVAHIRSVLGEDAFHATHPSASVATSSPTGFKVGDDDFSHGTLVDAGPLAACLLRESLLSLPPPLC